MAGEQVGVFGTELPLKNASEEELNNGVVMADSINNDSADKQQQQQGCISSVIPGWFLEISPMWPEVGLEDCSCSSTLANRVHEQILDEETCALQAELSSILDAVEETETKMVEMSALNHLMSTHVLHQAQQIELLYEQAIEATKNKELGSRNSSTERYRVFLVT